MSKIQPYPYSFHTNCKFACHLILLTLDFSVVRNRSCTQLAVQSFIKSLHLCFGHIQCLLRTILAKFEHCSLGSYPYYCSKKFNRIILSFSAIWTNITPIQEKIGWPTRSQGARTLHTGYHVIIHAATCFRVLCPLLENVDWCEAAQGISILHWLCSYCLYPTSYKVWSGPTLSMTKLFITLRRLRQLGRGTPTSPGDHLA